MAAVVRASIATSTGPTLASAESGAKFNREESLAGATNPVPKPNSAGTNYSYRKVYCLEVTTADATSLSNRRIHASGAPATGLSHFYRDDGATYNRANTQDVADNASTDGATPAGFTVMPTSATAYDAASVAANLGRNGDYVSVLLGVSSTYAGGAGTAIDVPDVTLTYDEL